MNANGSTRSGAGSSSPSPPALPDTHHLSLPAATGRSAPARGAAASIRRRVVAGIAAGLALEVVVVLGLSLPEGTRRAHPCDHVARPEARGIDVGDRVLGHLTLLVGGVEDLRAVVRPRSWPLTVLRCRVVDLEDGKDVPVGDPIRIERISTASA
jgi:hypothetical protein